MKAISDIKMAGIIKRLRSGAAYATYTIESGSEFHAALIEQASLMSPGSERLVYFYDDPPAIFSQGCGIVKMYYHEGFEQEGSAFVAAEIFDGPDRYYMNVIKSDVDGTWACTEKARVRTSADPDERGMVLEYDSGPANVETYLAFPQAKIFTVTLSSANTGRLFTVTLDWRALGNDKDEQGNVLGDNIWIPFEGMTFTVSKTPGEITLKLFNAGDKGVAIRRIVGYN